MIEPNIILTGFMGTGKTVVGRAVAERLGRFFVDMDEIIEQRMGKPVAAIFAEDGEARFRQIEAALCSELAKERNIIIATGGGAMVPAANRQALGRSGILICLSARPEEIIRRLEGISDRPLLATPDRQQRITTLLLQRAAAYAAIPHQLDTSGLTAEQVAEEVIRLARQQDPRATSIPVQHPGASYQIQIAEGLLSETGNLMAESGLSPGPCAVISTAPVSQAHGQRLLAGLREAGWQPNLIEIPDGEVHKRLATVSSLYDSLLAAGLDRQSPVIALGGGVVGDVAGYTAATFLRGMPFVQVPTSLLAMVDASVGGKTGVDLPQGKNLVGAFKQPALVVIDPEVLGTLPAVEFRSGLAEVVKHGIIGDLTLFQALEGTAGPLALADLIARAVQVKVAIVEEDPFEEGRRAVLNLGHTFAHALEVLSGYRMRHGEAVSVGLAAASRLAAALQVCAPQLVDRVESVLHRLDLPTRWESGVPAVDVLAAMATDKKRAGNRLRFVLPQALGHVDVFEDVPDDAVLAVLEQVC